MSELLSPAASGLLHHLLPTPHKIDQQKQWSETRRAVAAQLSSDRLSRLTCRAHQLGLMQNSLSRSFRCRPFCLQLVQTTCMVRWYNMCYTKAFGWSHCPCTKRDQWRSGTMLTKSIQYCNRLFVQTAESSWLRAQAAICFEMSKTPLLQYSHLYCKFATITRGLGFNNEQPSGYESLSSTSSLGFDSAWEWISTARRLWYSLISRIYGQSSKILVGIGFEKNNEQASPFTMGAENMESIDWSPALDVQKWRQDQGKQSNRERVGSLSTR
jgi:hypothetical protein